MLQIYVADKEQQRFKLLGGTWLPTLIIPADVSQSQVRLQDRQVVQNVSFKGGQT